MSEMKGIAKSFSHVGTEMIESDFESEPPKSKSKSSNNETSVSSKKPKTVK